MGYQNEEWEVYMSDCDISQRGNYIQKDVKGSTQVENTMPNV